MLPPYHRSWLAAVVVAAAVAGCARPRPTFPAPSFVQVSVEESGVVEDEDEMDITIPAFNPLTGAGIADQLKARFRGMDRKGAKTTIARGATTQYASVKALAAALADDNAMLNHNPVIERDTNVRVSEENHNVRVPAWIYAMKYEADQDWHVILGTSPTGTEITYFNAEISGLPATSAPAYTKLRKVRQQLAAIFDNNLPGDSGGYRKYTTPVPVLIEGSLFFDVDHDAGVVGPTGMRPATAWEIHPVTSIKPQ